jgi:hypothetical protein
MKTRNVLYYGREEALPEAVQLRAGPLALEYCAGEISNIVLGTHPVLQRIYVAVRDRNWGTIANVIANERIAQSRGSFEVSFDAENRQGEIDFAWHADITGNSLGNITFLFDGEVRRTFLTCRIGLCVLHPLQTCAGKACMVEKEGGIKVEGVFPRDIVSGEVPPFIDMTGMTYEVTPSTRVRLRFEGDLFEMEDQRNWTDPPYKTFCTPSRLECPREVKAGTSIRQAVRCSLLSSEAVPVASAAARRDEVVRVAVDRNVTRRFPEIGLGVASHGQPLSRREVDSLRGLHLSHLRVDLTPSRPGWRMRLEQAEREAQDVGVALEVAWHVAEADREVHDMAEAMGRVEAGLTRLLVFRENTFITEEDDVRIARRHLCSAHPAMRIGGGSNSDFSELNQHRAPFDLLDFVCYSMNPQVHATSDRVLVENLEAQAHTVESAQRFSNGLPIIISPVTLKQRFNPTASGPPVTGGEGELPPEVDVRQVSLLGACWTAGSLHYLSLSGVAGITYYETTGWRGVMETEAGSLFPGRFKSSPGELFPLYHVLADVGEFSGGEAFQTQSTNGLTAVGLGLAKQDRMRLLVANLTPQDRRVVIAGVEGEARVCMLDETNAETSMTDPKWRERRTGTLCASHNGELELGLLPLAVATIDWRKATSPSKG